MQRSGLGPPETPAHRAPLCKPWSCRHCHPTCPPQIVNLQSASQFASHRLNRDTWRNEMVRSLVENNFLLLQVRPRPWPALPSGVVPDAACFGVVCALGVRV